MAEPLELVAEHVGHILEGRLLAHHREPVAHLELKVGCCRKVDTRTVHPDNVHAEIVSQLEVAEIAAVNLRFGNHDTARNVLLILLAPFVIIHGHLFADKRCHTGGILGGNDHVKDVIQIDDRMAGRNVHRPVRMHDTRNDEPVRTEFLHIGDFLAREDGIRHLHGNGVRSGRVVAAGLFEPFVLSLYIDAENHAEQYHRKDDADNAQRIGHRIPHGNGGVTDTGRIMIRLLRCTETGGIGHGTAENTGHRSQLHIRHLAED